MGLSRQTAYAIALVRLDRQIGSQAQSVLFLGEPTSSITKSYITEILLPNLEKQNALTDRQEIRFNSKVIDQFGPEEIIPTRDFFHWLGFNECRSLDFSDHEGADILFNLNLDEVPSSLVSAFDFIYDGGTLEHVFNLPKCLETLNELLKIGGIIFHDNPANQMLDHGFYQISPTFYTDYYRSAKYEMIFAALKIVKSRSFFVINLVRYTSDIYRNFGGRKFTSNLPCMDIIFVARKTQDARHTVNVIQSYYYQNNKKPVDKSIEKNKLMLNDIKIAWRIKDILRYLWKTLRKV